MDADLPYDFTTLGMFIIDEIHFHPSSGKPPIYDVLGGAGTWALLGARLFSAPPLSKRLTWILDAGSDFPASIATELSRWSTSLVTRSDPTRLTTRGWNSYEHGDRAFRYLTPKKRLEVKDLVENGIDGVKVLHVISTVGRLRVILSDLKKAGRRPIIVYEPVPDGCDEGVRDELLEILPEVDVLSPNAGELRAFFKKGPYPEGNAGDEEMYAFAKELAKAMGPEGGGMRGIIVRAGARGSYTLASNGAAEWRPAYHDVQSRVVDPTGGGNTFLGAVCVAMARECTIFEAAEWGNVAASFAVEQVGFPVLEAGERWNGDIPADRLTRYRQRMAPQS